MEREINKKLRNMKKSEIEKICRKMKCPTGTKREMIRVLLLPLRIKYKMLGRPGGRPLPGHLMNRIGEYIPTPGLGRSATTSKGILGDLSGELKTRKINNKTLRKAVAGYLSNVTNMEGMFNNERKQRVIREYGLIADWDVRRVTDMSNLFVSRANFNEDLSRWNVSNVKDMGGMFSGARSFNGDLSKWNVSNVINMSSQSGGMFAGARSFNGDLSKWNVSNVKYMAGMFLGTDSFDRDINTKKVTLEDGTTYTAWDVTNVEYMHEMFRGSKKFNGDLSKWDVSNVRNMRGMFLNAESFNGDLSKWDVSNVRNMRGMFLNAESFNGDISEWDVSNVTNMEYMFEGASSFNINNAPWYVGDDDD
jgi:surface protein